MGLYLVIGFGADVLTYLGVVSPVILYGFDELRLIFLSPEKSTHRRLDALRRRNLLLRLLHVVNACTYLVVPLRSDVLAYLAVVFAKQLDSFLQLKDVFCTPPLIVVEARQKLNEFVVLFAHFLLLLLVSLHQTDSHSNLIYALRTHFNLDLPLISPVFLD